MNQPTHTMSSSLDSPQAARASPSSSPSSQSHVPTAATSGSSMTDGTNTAMRNYDGTEMRDARSQIVYKSQFLSTHPLKSDCKERVGYAGKKFTYCSGDGVIRTMNAIFGHGGWSTKITMERNVLNEKDERGRWNVGYLSTVRVTLLNGVSHEDCGSGEGIDNNKLKAHEKAMKSAITDAMKRASRHFGERLGNALYVKGSGMRSAPRTNKDALDQLFTKDALTLFGDQAKIRASMSPEKNKLVTPTTVANVIATAATVNNAVQKENWPQNRVGQSAAVVVATTSFHTRPSSNNVGQQCQPITTSGSTVLPSPIASSTSHRGGGISHAQQGVNTAGIRIGNPSPVLNNNNNNAVQKENWPQNRIGQSAAVLVATTSFNTRPSSNNVGQQYQPIATSGSTVLPSPIASSTSHRGGGITHAQQGVNTAGIRNGNPSPASNNNVNNVQQRSLLHAPPPSNMMAPPPRPMYNPGGGNAQYGVGGGHVVVNPNGGKRSLDAGVVGNNHNQQHAAGNNHNPNSYNNMNVNNNGTDTQKRQKANPYNNNNSNKRMSV